MVIFFFNFRMNLIRLWMPDLFYKIEAMPGATSKIVCEIITTNVTKRVTNCDEVIKYVLLFLFLHFSFSYSKKKTFRSLKTYAFMELLRLWQSKRLTLIINFP